MGLTTFGKQEVEQFTRAFEAQFHAGDAAAMASAYAADAKLLAEDTELIRGRPAIELFWRAAIEKARQAGIRRTITLNEVTSSGDLGYALGTVSLQIPPRAGQEQQLVVKYATIWQREAGGGTWELMVDISNRNPAR